MRDISPSMYGDIRPKFEFFIKFVPEKYSIIIYNGPSMGHDRHRGLLPAGGVKY